MKTQRSLARLSCCVNSWLDCGSPLRDHGFNGDPSLATRAIGEKMVALKVQAALAQIRRLEASQAVRAEP